MGRFTGHAELIERTTNEAVQYDMTRLQHLRLGAGTMNASQVNFQEVEKEQIAANSVGKKGMRQQNIGRGSQGGYSNFGRQDKTPTFDAENQPEMGRAGI